MCLLDGRHAAELLRQLMEAFLVGFLCHAVIHICPLVIFAFGRCPEVFLGRADSVQRLKPEFCVLLLVFRGLEEQRCDLLVACFLRHGGKICIFIARL